MSRGRIVLACALTAAVLAGLVLARGSRATRQDATGPAAFDGALPADAGELLFVQPFRIARAYRHDYERERREVTSGYLVVIESDPRLCVPYQERHPVLFAGDCALERVSFGYPGGRIVAILPASEDGRNPLEAAPIFWGTAALPEQLNAPMRSRELRLAEAAGLRPVSAEALAAARLAGGPSIELADRTELLRQAARLMLTWAPQEAERAGGMLAPLLR